MVTPTLYRMPKEPETIHLSDLAVIDHEHKVTPIQRSSRGRGIYTEEALKKMSQHMMFPTVKTALLNKLTEQAARVQPGQMITPSVLFPDYTLPGGSWQVFILGEFWAFIKKMGDATGIFLFIYYSIKLLIAFWQISHSFCHFYERYGISAMILYSMCPGQHHSKEVRNTHRKRKNEAEYASYPMGLTQRDTVTMKLSSYDEDMRGIISQEKYDKIPGKYNRQDIVIGTLQAAYDRYNDRQPSVRDQFLSQLPSAPVVINDLEDAMDEAFHKIYPKHSEVV